MDYSLLGTVAIPGLSLIVSVSTAYYFLRDRRHARYQMETTYIENLLAWHKEVIFCLMRLEKLPAERSGASEDLCVLYALTEQGRFFFPNVPSKNNYGAHKPLAYKGYRNLVLEMLVAIHQEYRSDTTDIEINVKYRRSFTSAVFSIVDPASRISELSQITAKKLNAGQSIRDYVNAEWR